MSKAAQKQNMPSSEDRKWSDPASILCRWKNDPNPVGTSENEDESTEAIIEIKKIADVESYMQEKFGGA